MSKRNPKSNTRDINAAQRVKLALKLRAQKLTYEEIAQQCGYANRGVCHNAVQREMQRILVEDVEELRREELAMLDILHKEMWQMAMDKDNNYRTFAVDRVLSISEARRKLMGLDIERESNIAAAQVIVRELPAGYLTQPLLPHEATS